MSNLVAFPEGAPEEQDPVHPEAMFISALLATGEFTPGKWQISDADFAVHPKLFRFCVDYQRKSVQAPPLELLTNKFPSFTFLPGLEIEWAAQQLHDASFKRDVRRGIREILRDLADDDPIAIANSIAELIQRPRVGQSKIRGVPVFDPVNVAERAVKQGIPMPWPTLDRLTGGIGLDELWVLAARFGVGKSNFAAAIAGCAAEHGRRVRVISLEMPFHKFNLRVLRYHARNDKALRDRLTTPGNPREREEALMEVVEGISGYVETFDYSKAKRITTATVEDACDDIDLLLIDHAGLLSLHDGRRAIEDWRVAAQISNMVREINLRHHVPIIQMVQINREGDGIRPPKASTISQSDAFGQDADDIITAAKYSTTTRAFSLAKNREGLEGTWYTSFDPAAGDYTQIDVEQANAIKVRDDERATSV